MAKYNDRKFLNEVCESVHNDIPSLVFEYKFENDYNDNGLPLTHKYVNTESPQLNDILRWYSLNNRGKYSHFEVHKGEAYFIVYDGEESYKIIWDLSKPNLHEQSEELIEWLAELI